MLFRSGMILLFPAFFTRLFSSDEVLCQTAVTGLHVYFFAFVFQALQFSGQTVFKSLGKRSQAIFFSLFRKVILVVPLTLLLPREFGVLGVFAAEPVSNVIGGIACYVTMYFTVWRKLPVRDGTCRNACADSQVPVHDDCLIPVSADDDGPA